jgi:flagellar P-ring protein precursor FlgI
MQRSRFRKNWIKTRGSSVASLIRAAVAFLLALSLLIGASSAWATRIKDIADVEGVRSNQLVGYGLVVGLKGTGDKTQTIFTVRSLKNLLSHMGISTFLDDIKVKNVAAVIVTADLPPFGRAGSKMDVVVSSLGDATSLQGGALLRTPLKGPDGNIYAVAQGTVVVGGLAVGGESGSSFTLNHPTVGRIVNGAVIEREIPFEFNDQKDIMVSLHTPDFTTVIRVQEAIDRHFGADIAEALDPGTVRIRVPGKYQGNVVALVADLETIGVQPDAPARVVLNERTGTVVIGSNVKISTVALSHGNLTVEVRESKKISQPPPFSGGETVTVPESEISVEQKKEKLLVVESGVNIGDLAKALNALGATPRDLIIIFQAIKAAGALQAKLEIM